MTTGQQQTIATEVIAALESGNLDLPTLPDMAIRIREAIDDPNVSAEVLIRLLSTDPVISAQIIKTANGAAFSSGNPVSDLRASISRLGYRMLHNLVITITLNKLFQADSPLIKQQLKKLWEHSREVAVNSYVLALHQRHLKPDQAMLAGLIHDIGALPLYLYADHHHLRLDQEALEGLIRKSATTVGSKLLQSWRFPDELVDVVAGHENLQRINDSELADYVDVVTVANLQLQGSAKFVAWENVTAAVKLGYSPAECQNFLSTHAEQLAVVQGMMGMEAAKPRQPASSAIKQPQSIQPASRPAKPESGRRAGLLRLFK